jgi:hypothetical protein
MLSHVVAGLRQTSRKISHRLRDLGFRWCAAQHRGQVQLSLWVGGSSITPDPRRPSNHAARFDQRRPIRGRAALAFPADVRAAGTRNSGDDHVSRQQPVTTRTALGRSVHPLRAREVHRLANINTHTHTLPSALSPNPGRYANRYSSLSLSNRVVVSDIFDYEPKPVQQN